MGGGGSSACSGHIRIAWPTTFGAPGRCCAWYAEQVQASYTGLGYLRMSYRSEQGKTTGPPGFVGSYYQQNRDSVMLDGLGNRWRAKQIAETGINGIGTPVTQLDTLFYRPRVGRVDSLRVSTDARRGSRRFVYDSAGNELFSSLSSGPTFCEPAEDRASFYDGLQRLVAEQRRWVKATCNLSNARERSLEQYRYDALGRRVWAHAKRECELVAAGYPEDAASLALQCRLGYMRRTVWDGPQELVEIQAPGAPADSALWEQDTGHYAARPLDTRSSPPKDPNRYYGQVVYTTGLAVDQPLSVWRQGYADRPAAANYTQWPHFGVIPLWDRQGTAKLGVFATTRAWARPLTAGDTQCRPGTSVYRCVQLVWPEATTTFDLMRGWAPQSYMGSLLEQKRTASGTYFRRARTYDPATGRFTQEDPIGLAGGVNLYGFANGDPVNFSDPFGLCPTIVGTTAPCELFAAIWAESRGANTQSQIGMASVLKNRVDQGFRGARSYEDAVWQRGAFSFTREDANDKDHGGNIRAHNRVMGGKESSKRFTDFAKRIEDVYTGATADPTGGATFYYSPRSMSPPNSIPTWASDGSKIFTMQVFDEFRAYRCANGRPNC